MTDMNFVTAMKHALRGETIRRKAWSVKPNLCLFSRNARSNNAIANSLVWHDAGMEADVDAFGGTGHYDLTVGDLNATDWELVQDSARPKKVNVRVTITKTAVLTVVQKPDETLERAARRRMSELRNTEDDYIWDEDETFVLTTDEASTTDSPG